MDGRGAGKLETNLALQLHQQNGSLHALREFNQRLGCAPLHPPFPSLAPRL
jgi:hypothetical protein